MNDHPTDAVVERNRSKDPHTAAVLPRGHDQLRHRGEPVLRKDRFRPRERDVGDDQLIDPKRRATGIQPQSAGMSGAALGRVGRRQQRLVVAGVGGVHQPSSIAGSGSRCTTLTRFVARVRAT